MNRFFLIVLLCLSKVVAVSGQQFYQNLGLGISASTMGYGQNYPIIPQNIVIGVLECNGFSLVIKILSI
jgi:hypothetical protein